jgi:hypothetical protein
MTVIPNGIDGVTGRYAAGPFSADDLIRSLDVPPVRVNGRAAGLPWQLRADRVEEAGWAVVCAEEEREAVQNAFAKLIEHRSGKVLVHKAGETATAWLARHGVGQGSVVPEKVPCYLLMAGSVARIPLEFSRELSPEYFAGRIWFDKAEDYASYAERLVALEQRPCTRRDLAFFATRHDLDPATQLSAEQLVTPLTQPDSRLRIASAATKANFLELLAAPPDLLFSASHGVAWDVTDSRQRALQGALLCQDWPPFEPVREEQMVAAADVPSSADLQGMIAFLFACFSAGTPAYDSFDLRADKSLAAQPFLSALPLRMLRAGAAAVVGHVDRAWGYSIASPGAGAQRQPFENLLGRLRVGLPVGFAMRGFADRFAALSVTMANLLRQRAAGLDGNDALLAARWVERQDAGGYLIVGDPAARLSRI